MGRAVRHGRRRTEALRYRDVMQRRRPLIAGNWKMYKLPTEAVAWLESFQRSLAPLPHDGCDVLLNVPFTHLTSMAAAVDGDLIALGAQDLSQHGEGAYTGEVSGAMIRASGARFVIVGHSERRAYHHENDAMVNAKLRAALAAGLVPILCVGESEAERDAGTADAVVLRQIGAALSDINASLLTGTTGTADAAKATAGAANGTAGAAARRTASLVVAYEPVWAIGTGKTATADDAQAMCATLRAALTQRFPDFGASIRILYGGSMKPGNASELLAQPDVDGGLIGGASLDQTQLLDIVQAAQAAVNQK